MYCFEGQRYIYLSLDNARTTYYAYTQGAEASISPTSSISVPSLKSWSTMAAPLAKTQAYSMPLLLSQPTQTLRQSASILRVTALLL